MGVNSSASYVITDVRDLFPKWSHNTIDIGKFPISFISCSMESLLGKSIGYGESFFPKAAIEKSLSEAWERQHLLYIRDYMPELREKTGGCSNGFAAGTSIKEARLRAKLELIERRIFLVAWTTMTGWNVRPLGSIKAKILSELLSYNDWKCRFFQLNAGQYNVTAGLAEHDKYGAIFDTSLMMKSKDAEVKTMLSLIKGIGVRKKSIEIGGEINETPESHGRFYADPRNLEAFNFLNTSSSSIDLLDIEENCFNYADFKLAPEMPYVSVAWHKDWPPMAWGEQSINGKNKWPHPQS